MEPFRLSLFARWPDMDFNQHMRKKELNLLEAFHVDMALAQITRDGRRMRVRNTFLRASDGALCAIVESVILWFDLAARKPVLPPDELRDAWLALARTDDFSWFEEKASPAAT